MKINPLMVVMGVRWFKPSVFWISQVDFLDKLLIKNYPHHEAHQIALKFLKEHPEYDYILIYAEDTIFTPDMVRLLISDVEKWDLKVVSGYTNWSFVRNWLNFTKKDLTYTAIVFAENYRFETVDKILDPNYDFPLTKVWFVGLPLTLIHRDVFIGWGAKPDRWVTDRLLGKPMKRGIMFDLSFAKYCARNKIDIWVDLRVFGVHYGDTRRFINLVGKKPEVKFIPKKSG